MDYRRVRQCAQKQTETVGLVHSLDILIRHAVWLFGQDDPAPPPHPIFFPRILAIYMTRPDWGWGTRAPPRGYATAVDCYC